MNWSTSAKEFYINVLNLAPTDLREIANDYLLQYIKIKGCQRSYNKENLQQHVTKIKLEKFKKANTSPLQSVVKSPKESFLPAARSTLPLAAAPPSDNSILDRKKRFANEANATMMRQADITEGSIVGTNMTVLKPYLRLTGPPNPAATRPLAVLQQALKLLRKHWGQNKDYSYICDQLKSIRQDLSVQNIRNEFTIQVYEYHGKIALEMQDIGEFNQSQTQLWQLYHYENIMSPSSSSNSLYEFTAYRILYFIFTKRKTELVLLLKELDAEQKLVYCIKHACLVRKAVDMNDCYEVLRLYGKCPNLGKHLMNLFIERVRVDALRAISRTFRKSVSMDFIAMMLGLKFEEAFNFLEGLIQAVSDDGLSAVFVAGDVCAVNCADLFAYVEERCVQLSKIDIKGQIY